MLSNIWTCICLAALVTGDTKVPAAGHPKPDPDRRQLQLETWPECGRAAGLHMKLEEAQWKRDTKKLLLNKKRGHKIY